MSNDRIDRQTGAGDRFALDGRMLRMFLAIYESNSITRTAETLGVSQSTVSHALERMRVAVQDPLFVKRGRGITPTEGAVAMVPRVRELLAGFEALTNATAYSPDTDTSTLTLACNLVEQMPFLDRLTALLNQMAPNLALRYIELGPREGLAHALDSGQADLAIAVRPERYAPTLQNALLFSDRHVIYYDPEVRGPITTLAQYVAAPHGVLDFGGTGHSAVSIALGHAGTRRTSLRFMAANSYALARMIRGTDVVATLPGRLERTSFHGFAHTPPPFSVAPVLFDLVWHRRSALSARHGWLRKVALQAAGGPA